MAFKVIKSFASETYKVIAFKVIPEWGFVWFQTMILDTGEPRNSIYKTQTWPAEK